MSRQRRTRDALGKVAKAIWLYTGIRIYLGKLLFHNVVANGSREQAVNNLDFLQRLPDGHR